MIVSQNKAQLESRVLFDQSIYLQPLGIEKRTNVRNKVADFSSWCFKSSLVFLLACFCKYPPRSCSVFVHSQMFYLGRSTSSTPPPAIITVVDAAALGVIVNAFQTGPEKAFSRGVFKRAGGTIVSPVTIGTGRETGAWIGRLRCCWA